MFAGLAYCFHDDVCICLFAVVTVYLLCLLCLQHLLLCVFAVFCRVFIIRCVAQMKKLEFASESYERELLQLRYRVLTGYKAGGVP